jgi:intracellular septation protein A
MSLSLLIPTLAPILSDVINRIAPDKDMEKRLNHELQTALSDRKADIEKAALDVIKTEAASNHWITSAWRPITMLTFVAIIVARVFGLTTDTVSEKEYLMLWDIVYFGIGGYAISRSVEKVVGTDTINTVFKNKQNKNQDRIDK